MNPVDLKASMQMLGLGLAGSTSVSILRLNLRTDLDTIEEIPTLVSGFNVSRSEYFTWSETQLFLKMEAIMK